MVCFGTICAQTGRRYIRPRRCFRDHQWSSSSMFPSQKRRSCYQRGHETIHGSSFALMECFDTPPKRTIFGTKNSEHWDSFQRKYSPSFDSNQLNFDRENKAIRRRYKLQAWNHDDTVQPPELRGKRRTKKWRLLWLLVGCWQSPRLSQRSDIGHDLEFQRSNCIGEECEKNREAMDFRRKKRIPLVERYSDYFERRNAR